jgi:hypothetical protein
MAFWSERKKFSPYVENGKPWRKEYVVFIE